MSVTEQPIDVAHPPAVREGSETDEIMAAWAAQPSIDDRRPETLPEVNRWEQIRAMAKALCRAPMMPAHIKESRDPEADLTVVLLTAHDLGISATLALQKVAVIDGKPALMAELMRTLALRDGHRLRFSIDRDDQGRPQAAHATGFRKEDPEFELRATYTIEDAVIARLCGVDADGNVRARSSRDKPLPWEAFTEDMLVARATARWCRRYAPDALGGVSYTPDELGEIGVVENEAGPAAPKYEPCSDASLALVVNAIDDLPEAQRSELREAWKQAKLGVPGDPPATSHFKRLSVTEVDPALALIARFAPDEAEIVPDPSGPHPFEGSETAEECAACGGPQDDERHLSWYEQHPDPAPEDADGGHDPGAMVPGYGDGRPAQTVGDPTAGAGEADAGSGVNGAPGPGSAGSGDSGGAGDDPDGPVFDLLPLDKGKGKRVVFVERRLSVGVGWSGEERRRADVAGSGLRVDYNPRKGWPVPLPDAARVTINGTGEVGVVKSDHKLGEEPF